MDAFTKNDLMTLAEKRDDPCLTIFMPTHRGGLGTELDRSRLKSLLKKAEEALVARGIRTTQLEKLLGPAYELLNDGLFWAAKSHGLALFLSPAFSAYHRLPLSFEESLVIASRFRIKPLLPLFSGEGHFYLLALSQKQLRFFEGTHYTINELDVRDIPKSRAYAMRYDDIEKQLQYHTGTSATRSGKRAPMFHGQGVGGELEKEYLREYFDQISSGLHNVLRDRHDPLVLAGVEYLFPIYREANSYPYLLDEGVQGNPEEQTVQELHRQAWPIAERYFLREREDRLAQYDELVGAARSSNDLREIIPAACAGRVDCLFLAVNVNVPGSFDPASGQVTVEPPSETGPFGEDLVDLAAVETLMHGGTVYPLEPASIPGRAPVAVIFRY